MRNHRITPVKLGKIQNDYQEAMGTTVAIAKRHKISRVHLWELAKEYGWEYGSEKAKAIQKFQQLASIRLNDQRSDTIEDHALELSKLREQLTQVVNMKEAKILEYKVTSLLKIIEGERLTYGLPNEYKYSEQKTEKTIRFEDMLKTINANKAKDYEIIEHKEG